MQKRIALNINFDSLSECLKLVGEIPPAADWKDPCYFSVIDRFFRIASDYNAPFSIYVIGKDLENPNYASAVANWRAMGHEIGNHSYSHRQDLNQLSYQETFDEIARSHEIISKAIGEEPKGFIAPGWSLGNNVVKALIELNYLYDSSLAPSWMLPLQQIILSLKSKGARNMIPLLRPDLKGNLFGHRSPYILKENSYFSSQASTGIRELVMLPLPISPVFRLAAFHTLAFQLPQKFFQHLLKNTLSHTDSFYYLMHPADLISPETDLEGLPSGIKNILRMNYPIQKKENLLRASLEVLKENAQFVTMKELASDFLIKNSHSSHAVKK